MKQIKFAGAPNFRHFNFMLIDKLLAYITEMDVMSLEPEGAPIRRWSPPEIVRNSRLGMNALHEEQMKILTAPRLSPHEERICVGNGSAFGFDATHAATLEAGRPAVEVAMPVEEELVVEDTAHVERLESIGEAARVEEELCGVQLSPATATQPESPQIPKSPRPSKKRRVQSPARSPERASGIPATISAAKRAASREVNGDCSEARPVSHKGSPNKLIPCKISVDNALAVQVFFELRAEEHGTPDFKAMTSRWNSFVMQHVLKPGEDHTGYAGLPITDSKGMEQFERDLAKKYNRGQMMAWAQVQSGGKMTSDRHGLAPGGGPSRGPGKDPYPYVSPQPIPLFDAPPHPPPNCEERGGVGKGGKGGKKTCRACAKNGLKGVHLTGKHRRECPYAKEKQALPGTSED